MNLRKAMAMVAPILLLAGIAANAYTFNDVNVEKWVGSGSNSAMVVVDFRAKSYAFGVNWDGALSGRQALELIEANTSLTAEFGLSWGGTNSISYDGNYQYSDTDEFNPNVWWWRYCTSADGQTWKESWDGSGTRMLTDGAWDGWIWYPPWPGDGVMPTTPVPEPSSTVALCSMIGLAGSAKLLSLRRK